MSLTQQLNEKSSLGGSYYIKTFKNKIRTQDTGETGTSSIDQRNNWLDQEVTLKYNTAFGQHGTTLEVIGDYYNRQHKSKSDFSYGENSSSASEDKTSLDMY